MTSHPLFTPEDDSPPTPAPRRSREKVALDDLCAVCEQLYNLDGFVTWDKAGQALGLSRQAVRQRVQKAVTAGRLDPATVRRWESIGTRAALSRERAKRNQEAKRVRRMLQMDIRFTEENHAWLRKTCTAKGVSASALINGWINQRRDEESKAATPGAHI